MTCAELLRTQAFLDGELDDLASREAERHIEICPECRTFSENAARLSDALRRGTSRYAASADLRSRIATALDAEQQSSERGEHRRRDAVSGRAR